MSYAAAIDSKSIKDKEEELRHMVGYVTAISDSDSASASVSTRPHDSGIGAAFRFLHRELVRFRARSRAPRAKVQYCRSCIVLVGPRRSRCLSLDTARNACILVASACFVQRTISRPDRCRRHYRRAGLFSDSGKSTARNQPSRSQIDRRSVGQCLALDIHSVSLS